MFTSRFLEQHNICDNVGVRINQSLVSMQPVSHVTAVSTNIYKPYTAGSNLSVTTEQIVNNYFKL